MTFVQDFQHPLQQDIDVRDFGSFKALASNARITIGEEQAGDAARREALLDAAFGRKERLAKTCQRLRDGRLPAQGLSLVARQGSAFVGTIRMWHVDAGGVPALLLGPLAVSDAVRSQGIGGLLMDEALARAENLGHHAVILIGDAPYYERFGFSRAHTLGLAMPGPIDEARFLGLELEEGALAQAQGLVKPTGAFDLKARRRKPMSARSQRAIRHAA